jgi:hypothetical protein
MRKNTSTGKAQAMKGRKSVLSNRSLFLKATILLSIVIGMMGAPRALADDNRYTFSNDTGVAANDLHVWFNQSVTAVRDHDGNYGAFGSCADNGSSSPEFDNGKVAADSNTTIRFTNTGSMSIKRWFWTLDGERIGRIHRGNPMAVSDVIPVDDIDFPSITMTSALASSAATRSQAVPESQVVTVVVAAPRLGIARVPNHDGPIIHPADKAIAPVSPHCKVIGAAENFPGRNRRLLVRLGSKIVFRLSRDTEAVIFDRACGLVAASALLQQWTPPGPGSISDEAHYWTTIDRNRRYARGCGPMTITGDCPVGVKPDRVGEYRYRVCLTTYAFPMTPTLEYNSNNLGCHGISEDCINFKVRVVGIVPTPSDLEWLAADGPELTN